jgi:hypothetical protein
MAVDTQALHGWMRRPYSEVTRLRSRKSTSKRRVRRMSCSASLARRQVLPVSPGHDRLLRAEPLMSRMRDGEARDFCRRSARAMAARAASHSTGSGWSGSAKARPARRVRGDLRYSR